MLAGSHVAMLSLPLLSCLLLSLLVIPLRCCSLALLSCPPPLVLVIVMLLMFVLFFLLRRSDREGDAIAIWAEPAWWGSAPCPRPSVTQRIVQSWSIREHASPPLGCCLSCSRASRLCFIMAASSCSLAAAHGLHPTVIPSRAIGDMLSHWPLVQKRKPRWRC